MRDKILDGSSIEELAEFWDTHDATDYWDELEEVREPIFFDEKIDELVIAQADDDSAWEEPIKVK